MSNDDQNTNGMQPKLRFPRFNGARDWQFKQLGELFTIGSGKDYRHLGLGNVPVYGTGGYMLSVDDYLYDGESVCIGRKGTIDKPLFLSGKFWTVDTLFFTHSFKACIPKFIFSIFQNIDWKKHNEAGGLPSLSKKVIEEIIVSIPELEEQHKIADCLTSVDDLIHAEGQKLEALKRYKKGLMQELFPAEGETLPKRRFPEFKDAPEWNLSSLGDVSSVSSGGTPSRTKSKYWNGNIPWVTTTLIDFNIITYANEFITDVGLKKSSAKEFPKGTILMAMYGQGKTRGKVAVLGIDAAINQACAAITLSKGMNEQFVFQSLAARYEEIRKISNSGGQENLSGELVKKIPLSYPDIESGEQQRIASFLISVDENISAQSRRMDALRAHKRGLMQGLFSTISEVQHG
ncbi:restriction endonuclease subunit S [Agrobacterium sp.]|uniref:restriction endonuclease subunit S n=1 Tax=Agrobacterium sp. TaxID=361 RepID=UPI0028A0A526|nr:restriction endonuclease subunit S [Agrobacterium sp.]